ncbi:MAG: transcription termination/antitermination protein NusA [Deltaproteobacteria bacterium]|nr:transcription termination/antitermination protein NusA [Deltaproteobacteria bacterium]MBT8465265.1 transcription termination/antitermination protein NusA [Deltaproteobacteria bacterium]
MAMQQSALSLQHVIEQVSQEKGIDAKILVEATEQAILTAAKKTFGPDRELEARFNTESGAVDLFQYMTVVESVENSEQEITVEEAETHGLEAEIGEELGFQIFYLPEDREKAREQDKQFGELLGLEQSRSRFGRIAAQTAKQVIIQRVRDAERERVFLEYKGRQGEIITGVVRRFERGSNIIVDLGRGVEAVLPPREQTPRESYRPGDRIVALLKDIDREARGPQIILSRTDVGILVKLFEMEVPEIYEGIVRIVAAAREPGARSKIAVSSRDSDVDPVGACVGMKGSRVQAVVQELRGEKIDIVPWDRDPARFVCNAIAPAEVVRVVIDEGNSNMELVVPDAKLSLAIGRRGQNVRLASQLSGWRLDIVSESRFQQIEEEAMAALSRLSADEELSRSLYRMGFRSLDEVVEASEGELASVPGVSAEDVAKLREDAASAMEDLRRERLAAMAEATEAPSERDKLLLVRGVNSRVADKLEQNSYSSVDAIAGEEDTDRLAIKSGLGAARAQALKAAVADFVQTEWPPVEVKMLESVAAAEAEAARLEAEAAAAAEAEAAALAAAEAQAAADAEKASEAEAEAETASETEAGSEAETTQETR